MGAHDCEGSIRVEANNVAVATALPAETTEQDTQSIEEVPSTHGSSVADVIFNFTNCIIGAGAIGLGGAIALSGGLVSVVTIAFFAVLTKLSLDLVIELSVETGHSSYEDLGKEAFGLPGRLVVVAAKFCYSFGCLVAYVVVVKDNLGPAIHALANLDDSNQTGFMSFVQWLIDSDDWLTWCVSSFIILPLCLLRDMTPLAGLSILSVVAMLSIVVIVVYLFFMNPHNEIRHDGGSFYERWIEVKWGYLECLGTFVFTFVSQHTVHLAYGSLKPELRTVKNWKKVSSASLFVSAAVSLAVAVFVYMSFWGETKSDIFQIYPSTPMIDLAKLLLCVTMLLTFPLPFFTCRELIILTFFPANSGPLLDAVSENDELSSLREPLLEEGIDVESHAETAASTAASLTTEQTRTTAESLADISSVISSHAINIMSSCLLPDDERQLRLPYHVAVTCKLWFVVTGLAIAAPNLGDVLDLVGCASGTIIAFIFPAALSFKLRGYSASSMLIMVVGGLVGVVGTYFSLCQLFRDLMK